MGKWKTGYDASRKYNKDWESQYNWVSYKDGFCFCELCQVSLKGIKKSNLALHESTKKHKTSVENAFQNVIFSDNNPDPPSVDTTTVLEESSSNILNSQIKFKVIHQPNIKELHHKLFTVNEGSVKKFKIEPTDDKRTLFMKKENFRDGSFIIVGGDKKSHYPEDSFADYVKKLSKDVTDVFRVDMEAFLSKNGALVESIKKNPGFVAGPSGTSRLTRMLVGHMAQQYLMDYSIDSWKDGSPACSRNVMATKLDAIEQTMEESVREMQDIKAQLGSLGESFSTKKIVLDSLKKD